MGRERFVHPSMSTSVLVIVRRPREEDQRNSLGSLQVFRVVGGVLVVTVMWGFLTHRLSSSVAV